jgi:hypothetical protein
MGKWGRFREGVACAAACAVLAIAPAGSAQAPAGSAPKGSATPAPTPAPAPTSTPAPTPAQEPAPNGADDLQAQAAARKKVGDDAMEALQYADALAAYGDAYAITKDTALLYNMGRALQALNRFPEALEKLKAFDTAASPELKARVPRLSKLISEIRERVSTLTVRTNVEGARVLVRNVVVGKAPLSKPLELVSGSAEIEVAADGYFPARKTVDLPGGGEMALTLDLFSTSTTGLLAVKASVVGAEVLVDDKRIGVAPIELNVPKGTHRVVVKHRDYRVYETTAVVTAGGTKTVEATLETASVLTRWWFWSAVGAVVTAGVIVTIAATTERAPDSGTIAPGQLPASWTAGPRAGTGPTVLPGLLGNPALLRF